jgi:hypothetical protein
MLKIRTTKAQRIGNGTECRAKGIEKHPTWNIQHPTPKGKAGGSSVADGTMAGIIFTGMPGIARID